MTTNFIKKIKNYSIISFIVPLLAINLCFVCYKYLGDMDIRLFTNFEWEKKELTIPYNDYVAKESNKKNLTFTSCPKYFNYTFYVTTDNQTISSAILTEESKDTLNFEFLKKENTELIDSLAKNKKLKTVIVRPTKMLNMQCVKNYPILYTVLKKNKWFEKMLIHSVKNNPSGFAKVKNPYVHGEVSISRTARFYPATLIFKPLIILSALILLLYWKNNLNLFNELKNKNILSKFSKSFFYVGLLSCIFLMLHAIFLGVDIDSEIFKKIRRLIIILFILSEISAQIILTKNLFIFKQELKNYIKPLVLKIKVTFVILVFFITLISFGILIFADPSSNFKHMLEWNYFSFLLFYYLLSRLLWR